MMDGVSGENDMKSLGAVVSSCCCHCETANLQKKKKNSVSVDLQCEVRKLSGVRHLLEMFWMFRSRE